MILTDLSFGHYFINGFYFTIDSMEKRKRMMERIGGKPNYIYADDKSLVCTLHLDIMIS